eukprot:scaffold492224_cov20-Prasinocladus_malaysianus.AAC.1
MPFAFASVQASCQSGSRSTPVRGPPGAPGDGPNPNALRAVHADPDIIADDDELREDDDDFEHREGFDGDWADRLRAELLV